MDDSASNPSSASELDERTRRLLRTIDELQEAAKQSTDRLKQQQVALQEALQKSLTDKGAKDQAATRLGTRTPELERSLGSDVNCLRCLRLIHDDLAINRDAEVVLELHRAGMGSAVVAAMDRYPDNDMVQHYACSALAELAVSGLVSRALVADGAHARVLRAMDAHSDCRQVQACGVRFISRCAGRDANLDALVGAGAARRVYAAMDRFGDERGPEVQRDGAAALERLVRGGGWLQTVGAVTLSVGIMAGLVAPALMRSDVCGSEHQWADFIQCARDVLHNTAAGLWAPTADHDHDRAEL